MNNIQNELPSTNTEATIAAMVCSELNARLGTAEEQKKAIVEIVVSVLLKSSKVKQHMQALIAEQITKNPQITEEQHESAAIAEELCYHSSVEIRAVIEANLEELKNHPMFSGADFSLTTLKAYVKSRITMRRDDTYARFSQSVSNAVINWPANTSPFQRSAIRGHYKFR